VKTAEQAKCVFATLLPAATSCYESLLFTSTLQERQKVQAALDVAMAEARMTLSIL
jgi:hypothetical protein